MQKPTNEKYLNSDGFEEHNMGKKGAIKIITGISVVLVMLGAYLFYKKSIIFSFLSIIAGIIIYLLRDEIYGVFK